MKRNLPRHGLTLFSASALAVAVATVLLLGVEGMRAQHSAPETDAHAQLEGFKDGKKPDKRKDAGKPVKPKEPAALPQPEVLCERIQFAETSLVLSRTDFSNCEVASEKKKQSSSTYGLSLSLIHI